MHSTKQHSSTVMTQSQWTKNSQHGRKYACDTAEYTCRETTLVTVGWSLCYQYHQPPESFRWGSKTTTPAHMRTGRNIVVYHHCCSLTSHSFAITVLRTSTSLRHHTLPCPSSWPKMLSGCKTPKTNQTTLPWPFNVSLLHLSRIIL